MRIRTWISIITVALLVLVLFLARGELLEAWLLLEQVDLWILALMIPVQIISYYAIGGMIFSYLRRKKELKKVGHWQTTRMALELNFVNHVLPSGGAAGFSYLGWVLTHYGVRPGRATMAQIIRFFLTFVSFVIMLIIAVAWMAFDLGVSRFILVVSILLVIAAVGGSLGLMHVISREQTLKKFARWLTRTTNRFVAWLTRGKKPHTVQESSIEEFFADLHKDYREILAEKNILWRPFLWSFVANITDVLLIFIAFWALGVVVNPAIILVAYGIASIVGSLAVTPGGTGAYEAMMIATLASAGVPPHSAIAGTLLARVILLVGTVVLGYIFYQVRLVQFGERSPIEK